MKIVALSDTHNKHNKITVPDCDVLIHSGDESGMGRESEIRNFAKWLSKQPAKNILWTPGNHSVDFERSLPNSLKWFKEECPQGVGLINEEIVIDGVKFWASPETPFFYNWAFNRARTPDMVPYHGPWIKETWDKIPDDVNILVTHGPPYGILDELVYVDGTPKGEFVGCQELSKRISQLKDLDLHIFGHIHIHGGCQKHIDGVSYYNASVCDEQYMATNPITVIDYEKE
jgi:predicted phosphodiesterase